MFKSSLIRFSIMDISALSSSLAFDTTQGTYLIPSSFAALKRLSPDTSSYPSSIFLTVSGCMIPNCLILSASLNICSSLKTFLGWFGFGTILDTSKGTISLPRPVFSSFSSVFIAFTSLFIGKTISNPIITFLDREKCLIVL